MSVDVERRVFVLMPFRPDFDDVYAVVRDACADAAPGVAVRCTRSDEITTPGKITDQIVEAIRDADVLVADLTDSNPNVMYELGYGHALGKPAIIINQSVSQSPFDVAGLRQIVYDRNRLVRDCRPRLITALAEVLGDAPGGEAGEVPSPGAGTEPPGLDAGSPTRPLAPSLSLIAEMQGFHLMLELANTTHDTRQVRETAARVFDRVDRIAVVGGTDAENLRGLMGIVGNCAVELEEAELLQEAEDLWKRAIGFCPTHAGLHRQYASFLVDRGRVDEAVAELERARDIEPHDPRIQTLEVKINLARGAPDASFLEALRARFEGDPADADAAAAYLLTLRESQAPLGVFEDACMRWADAVPDEERWVPRRALADRLAECDEHERARQIYESLLPVLADAPRRHDLLHNLATVCASLGRKQDAETYWGEAYAMNRSDPVVRAAFSQRLSSWGKLEQAMRVSAGEPLLE